MNESALKTRLKAIAKEKESTLNKIWKQLLLERFLTRLSISSFQNDFIFKGGLLLAQYININRETVDIDFAMRNIESKIQKIEEAFQEITNISCDDGFNFTWFSITELQQPHMEYDGFRVTLNTTFGNMQDKIHIDLGIGDVVEPIKKLFNRFSYKGEAIFPDEISLLAYPPETIFAEKLETVISKGAFNSRMKDYHDLFLMIQEPNLLNVEDLKSAILNTFSNRHTPINLSIHFNEEEIKNLQNLWMRHLQGLGVFQDPLSLPNKISDVILSINKWVKRNVAFPA